MDTGQGIKALRLIPGASYFRADPAIQTVLGLVLIALALVFVFAPLWYLLVRSLFDSQGIFVGLAQFWVYFETPSLVDSLQRSLRLSTIVAAVTTVLAFLFALALTTTRMPAKGFFRAMALIPLMAPSLLMAISLVYWFGNQGLLKSWMGQTSIYGELGITLGSMLWTFPHALMVLLASLASRDGRLPEAAQSLGASQWRVFWTVTVPQARYGLLMSFVLVFVLVITDFGVAKVIGGQANVLATDLYRQVIGQQNFSMGAVVGVVLLLPAIGAFVLERHLRARQAAALTARASIAQPLESRLIAIAATVFCSALSIVFIAMIGMAVFAAFASFWPYNLQPSWRNFQFDDMDGGGWQTYWNSIRLGLATAVLGTLAAFTTAWLVEKSRAPVWMREALSFFATLPMAIPGLALGLGYILFFNQPDNPLNGLYGGIWILVFCTVAHFFSTAHLTLVASLQQLDREFERVAESLGQSFLKTLARVSVPVCLPAILEVAGYFFVNALTTVSAVVFLYSPSTQLASVAVLNMDDAGDVAPAAAMAVLIFLTAVIGRTLFALLSWAVLKRTQQWRVR
nr:Sulfate transport system permease protein CysW [Cupriavidus sp.]